MALPALVKPLSRLLTNGSCTANESELQTILPGLAHLSADGTHWVISQRLLTARQQLNDDNELIAALLATQERLRVAWARVMAARCHEAGELSDPLVLARLISQLNGATIWVDTAFSEGAPILTIEATPYTELERHLFGATADQSQATPVLARVLSVASQLGAWQQQPLTPMPAVIIDGSRPDVNWCNGRLIPMPGNSVGEVQYLLNGKAHQPVPTDSFHLSQKQQTLTVMDWVLANPWAYLLALIAYEQNVWQVEVAGGLLLELPAGQSPQQPTEVQVLVANSEGDELYCGSLGTFIIKLLSGLNMGLFNADNSSPSITDAQLNAGLSRLIGELLAHKVWKYSEGLSGQQGFYQIHPAFADACYGLKGQPPFARYGRHLRQAIRSQAVQWRSDRQVESHPLKDTPPKTEKASAA